MLENIRWRVEGHVQLAQCAGLRRAIPKGTDHGIYTSESSPNYANVSYILLLFRTVPLEVLAPL